MGTFELADDLAEKIYQYIRTCDIAQNINLKAENMSSIKNYIFYQKHKLDKYGEVSSEYKYDQFDVDLQQF